MVKELKVSERCFSLVIIGGMKLVQVTQGEEVASQHPGQLTETSLLSAKVPLRVYKKPKVHRLVIIANLVLAQTAQVLESQETKTRGQRSGHLLGHGRPVGRRSQQVVQAAVSSVVGSWFEAQKI